MKIPEAPPPTGDLLARIAGAGEGYRPSTAADLRLEGREPPARTLRSAAPAADAGASPAQQDAADRLRELQRLRDEGLITAEQFEQRRAAIVEEL